MDYSTATLSHWIASHNSRLSPDEFSTNSVKANEKTVFGCRAIKINLRGEARAREREKESPRFTRRACAPVNLCHEREMERERMARRRVEIRRKIKGTGRISGKIMVLV